MAAARCDEGRPETETGSGMKFPYVMGKEIPRKMMIGVERNTETGTEADATTGKAAAVDKHSPGRKRMTLRNARRKTDGTIQERRSKLARGNQPKETAVVVGLGTKEGFREESISGAGLNLSGHARCRRKMEWGRQGKPNTRDLVLDVCVRR